MGLYDVIGEISQHNVLKSETGDNRIYGVILGTVASNYHQDFPGRVCVNIPTRGISTTGDTLKWARVAQSYLGKEWGHYFLPEVGDQVLLAFEDGQIDKPYVIGAIPRDDGTDKSKLMTSMVDEKNTYKTITTRNGSYIKFTDNDDDDKGKKDIIEIQTAEKMHRITLNNETQTVTISDEKGNNSIVMQTSEDDGKITVKCKKRFEIQVNGDNPIKLILNGDNGRASIQASEVVLEASGGNFTAKASGKAGIEGSNMVEIKGASVKVDSQGLLSMGGSPVKLG